MAKSVPSAHSAWGQTAENSYHVAISLVIEDPSTAGKQVVKAGSDAVRDGWSAHSLRQRPYLPGMRNASAQPRELPGSVALVQRSRGSPLAVLDVTPLAMLLWRRPTYGATCVLGLGLIAHAD
jgi:hypothetical protein